MNSFIKTWPNRFLLVTLISLLVLAFFVNSAFAESNGSGREKIARQVVKNYIQIGTEQFRRGQYVSAEKTLLLNSRVFISTSSNYCEKSFGSPAILGPSGSHSWLLGGSEDP